MPAERVFDMATRRGAEALGLDGCGVLEVGARADLVAIDPAAPHLAPAPPDHLASPVSALVYSAGPQDVRHVWIDGEPVVRDGRLLAWNLQETLEGARRALARVVERAAL